MLEHVRCATESGSAEKNCAAGRERHATFDSSLGSGKLSSVVVDYEPLDPLAGGSVAHLGREKNDMSEEVLQHSRVPIRVLTARAMAPATRIPAARG